MELGAFSVSLSVADVAASETFYRALGFEPVAGDGTSMRVMRNGSTTLGLFRGMFDRNMLTFNPGWDQQCRPVDGYTDVRELQRRLREAGIEPVTAADEATTGPASLVVIDPDGNPVLVDQHV